jgi:hypothetical protein
MSAGGAAPWTVTTPCGNLKYGIADELKAWRSARKSAHIGVMHHEERRRHNRNLGLLQDECAFWLLRPGQHGKRHGVQRIIRNEHHARSAHARAQRPQHELSQISRGALDVRSGAFRIVQALVESRRGHRDALAAPESHDLNGACIDDKCVHVIATRRVFDERGVEPIELRNELRLSHGLAHAPSVE